MTRRLFLAVPLFLAVLAPQACDDEDGGPTTEFLEARSRWEARGPTDYDLVLARVCFCPVEVIGPARIEVRADEVVSRIYVESGEPVREGLESFFPDVDGLFAFLDDAFERGAHSIEVEYDPDLGFPTRSFVDFDERVADEEMGHRVIELEIVRP